MPSENPTFSTASCGLSGTSMIRSGKEWKSRSNLPRRFGGWLRLQSYTVHGDNGVRVLLAGLGRGVPVAHFRKRLVGRVVVRHQLEQWAAKLADWRPRQSRAGTRPGTVGPTRRSGW